MWLGSWLKSWLGRWFGTADVEPPVIPDDSSRYTVEVPAEYLEMTAAPDGVLLTVAADLPEQPQAQDSLGVTSDVRTLDPEALYAALAASDTTTLSPEISTPAGVTTADQTVFVAADQTVHPVPADEPAEVETSDDLRVLEDSTSDSPPPDEPGPAV